MIYNYNGLWTLMEKRKISKDALKKKMSLSSATIARMTAGQPVGLEIIGRLCDEFNCNSNDILLIEPEHAQKPWQRIEPDVLYKIFMFFYVPASAQDEAFTATYLYGYAAPDNYKTNWRAAPAKGNLGYDFWEVTGSATGNELLAFLSLASANMQLKAFLNETEIFVDDSNKKRGKKITEAINNAVVCNSQSKYRPEFLQPASSLYDGVKKRFKPLVSLDDGGMFCESLFGLNKKKLYRDADGKYTANARLYWQYLKSKFKKWQPSEMGRLGNFEVFTPLLGRDAVTIEANITTDKNGLPKNARGVIITLSHRKLRGEFLVKVTMGNTTNPTASNIYTVKCSERADGLVKASMNESVSWVEVEIWPGAVNGVSGEIIYHNRIHFIKHILLNMQVEEHRFTLQSAWNKALKKGSAHSQEIRHYSTFSNSKISETQEAPWEWEETQTQDDYFALLGDSDDFFAIESRFFRENEKNTRASEFVEWLKKILSLPGYRMHNANKVIIIDPFIDAAALEKIILSISNSDISYDVITDASPRKTNRADSEKRLNEIRKLKETLDFITPADFQVRAISKSNGALHDRFIIILDSSDTPKVYILSNSLDGMAASHASVVAPVCASVAREITEYYLDFFDSVKETNIEILYNSKEPRNINHRPAEINDSKVYNFDEFPSKYKQSPSKAIESLAYMQPKEARKCEEYILSQNKSDTVNILRDIIKESHPNTNINEYYKRRALSLCQLLNGEFDPKGIFLENAEHYLEYSFDLHNISGDWSLYNGAKLLWKVDRDAFAELLAELVKELNASQVGATKLLPLHITTYTMAVSPIDALVYQISDEIPLDGAINSSLSWIRALAVAALLFFPKSLAYKTELTKENLSTEGKDYIRKVCEIIIKDLSPKEAWLSLIFLTKKLQISVCNVPSAAPKLHPIFEYVATQMANLYSAATKASETADAKTLMVELAPLNFRNINETCRILRLIYQNGALKENQYIQCLIDLGLGIYEGSEEMSKNYYTIRDIEEGIKVIEYLEELGLKSTNKFRAEMQKKERNICAMLSPTYLRSQDYSKWHILVDKLACFVALEHHLALKHNDELVEGKGVRAFEEITSRDSENLKKYSQVYVYAKELEKKRICLFGM